jgi:hypothetical protein
MGIEVIRHRINRFRDLMILFLVAPWIVFVVGLTVPYRLPITVAYLWSGFITITFGISIFMVLIWRDEIRPFTKEIAFFESFLQEAEGCVEVEHYSPYGFPFSKDERIVFFSGKDDELPQDFAIEVLKPGKRMSNREKGTPSNWYRHPYLRVSTPYGAEPKFAIVDGSIFPFCEVNVTLENRIDIGSFPFPYLLSIQRLGGKDRNELVTDIFDRSPNTENILDALRMMNSIRQETLPSKIVDSKPKRSGWAIQRCAATGFCKQCDRFVVAAEMIRGAERTPCPRCGGMLTGALYRLNQ